MKILININHQLTTINQPILTNNHIPFEHQPWLSLEVTWQGGHRVGRNPSIGWELADFCHTTGFTTVPVGKKDDQLGPTWDSSVFFPAWWIEEKLTIGYWVKLGCVSLPGWTFFNWVVGQ
jgi:hypothetical protein